MEQGRQYNAHIFPPSLDASPEAELLFSAMSSENDAEGSPPQALVVGRVCTGVEGEAVVVAAEVAESGGVVGSYGSSL